MGVTLIKLKLDFTCNLCLSCVVALSLSGAVAAAESLPKAELGIGLASQYLGDYRGSDEARVYALPFPILIYRGEIVQADRSGIRGRFSISENVEFTISGEAALNGGSKNNKMRAGMTELDSAFEIGPAVNINLTGESFDSGWALRLPVRAVFAVSFDNIEHIGYNANPKLTYRKPNLWQEWEGKLDVGFLWASEQYHDYYYSVAPEFVTDTRPFYSAKAGYSGAYSKISMKKRWQNLWVGWNLRYDNLAAAEFSDSPLMETNHYFSTSLAFGWMFWQSRD
jgi:Outer membrane protein V